MKIELTGYNPIPSIISRVDGDTQTPQETCGIFIYELEKAGVIIESEDEYRACVKLYTECVNEFIERKTNGN